MTSRPRLQIGRCRSLRLHEVHTEVYVADDLEAVDPHTYTNGRWLDRDEERREARTLRFDFDALLALAVSSSPGARHVVGCEKKEGGFNRVFMIQLDNGKTVVARLPTRMAGPTRLSVSSEVATLKFVKEKTKIPVPNVLSWSSEANNTIGAEYIIMEAMPGVPLNSAWSNMTVSQHIECIQSLGKLFLPLWRLKFASYGSLYLNSSSPPAAVPLDDTFSIGPLCASHHWSRGTSKSMNDNDLPGDLGPWHSVEAYLLGLLSQAQPLAPANADQDHRINTSESVDSRPALLETVRQTLQDFLGIESVHNASGPTLLHPDLHSRNIFVAAEDPTIITAVIDWQAAAIEPTFLLAVETPDFAEEITGDESLPEVISTEADESGVQVKIRADAEFCAKAWALMLQICPNTRAACSLDPSMVRLLAAGSAGWLKDTLWIQKMLLELGAKWKELGLPGQSHYRPDEVEMKDSEHRLDLLKADQRLREHLARLLGCNTDGWVPKERWDEVLPVYRKEYQGFVNAFLDEKNYGGGKGGGASRG